MQRCTAKAPTVVVINGVGRTISNAMEPVADDNPLVKAFPSFFEPVDGPAPKAATKKKAAPKKKATTKKAE